MIAWLFVALFHTLWLKVNQAYRVESASVFCIIECHFLRMWVLTWVVFDCQSSQYAVGRHFSVFGNDDQKLYHFFDFASQFMCSSFFNIFSVVDNCCVSIQLWKVIYWHSIKKKVSPLCWFACRGLTYTIPTQITCLFDWWTVIGAKWSRQQRRVK